MALPSELETPSSKKSLLATGMANVVLRGLTIVGKFALILVLGRFLSPADVGAYALMLATVTTVGGVLGMQFYLYTTREMRTHEHGLWLPFIRDQFAFFGLVYLVALPASVLLFTSGLLPWALALPFYALLVLEHGAAEFSRLLIPLEKPLLSNLVLFLRSGAWVYVLAAAMVFLPETRSLEAVWWSWAAGALIATIVGALWVLRLTPGGESRQLDKAWIKKGLKASILFSAGAFFLNGILTIDRYALSYFRGEELVGVYGFYGNMANLIQTVAETGVAVILLPTILSAFAQGDLAKFKAAMARLLKNTLLAMVFSVALAVGGLFAALQLLRHPEYGAHLPAFWILIGMGVLNTIGMVPHYGLYAMHRERQLMWANGAGLAMAVVLNLALTPAMGITGTALATASAMGTVFLVKALLYRRALVHAGGS